MLLTFQIDPRNDTFVSLNAHYIEGITVTSDFTIFTSGGNKWILPMTDFNKTEYDRWCAHVKLGPFDGVRWIDNLPSPSLNDWPYQR